MKNFIKGNEHILYFLYFMFGAIVLIVGLVWLSKEHIEIIISLILGAIVWIFYLYIDLHADRKDSERKYEQLLHFSHRFYKEAKQMEINEDDLEDYSLGDFKNDFEDWFNDKKYYGWIK